WCSSALCFPTCLLAALLIGLYKGCFWGSVAILIAALCLTFLTLSLIGVIAACAFNESVGEVLSPPVIASAPCLWIVANFLIAPVVAGSLFGCPCVRGGSHQISTP